MMFFFFFFCGILKSYKSFTSSLFGLTRLFWIIADFLSLFVFSHIQRFRTRLESTILKFMALSLVGLQITFSPWLAHPASLQLSAISYHSMNHWRPMGCVVHAHI